MGFSCSSVDTRLAKDAQSPGVNTKHPRNKYVWDCLPIPAFHGLGQVDKEFQVFLCHIMGSGPA